MLCTQCHDRDSAHIDGQPRTYAFNSAYYGPSESGVAYASGYRLLYVNGQVPLMIPSQYGITFDYNAGLMKNTAFRLCFECHEMSKVFDDIAGDGLSTRFKATLPNPPRNYSYAWGSGVDVNEHVAHLQYYIQTVWDSDWDTGTTGSAADWDSLVTCSSCHNVHGAAGNCGSTNEPMIRDGTLAGRTGYGFSYVVEDSGAGGYPWVTSAGATQANSVGAILRNNTANMCGGSACHGDPAPPGGCGYDASGYGWGSYLEFYRPGASGACCDPSNAQCSDAVLETDCRPPLEFHAWVLCNDLDPPCGQGACCTYYGDCDEVLEDDCPDIDRQWLGPGTWCEPDPCPVGACCVDWVDHCEEWTEFACTDVLGQDVPG